MRRVITGLAIFICIIMLPMSAWAKNPNATKGHLFITDAEFSLSKRATPFAYNETPWLCAALPNTASDISGTWRWGDDSPANPYLYNFDTSVADPAWTVRRDIASGHIWITFAKWNDPLAPVKKVGNWHINDTLFSNGSIGNSENYVFTPEPISSALFVLGGALLVVRQYRRKRRSA